MQSDQLSGPGKRLIGDTPIRCSQVSQDVKHASKSGNEMMVMVMEMENDAGIQ
jgi:hypothetical protein